MQEVEWMCARARQRRSEPSCSVVMDGTHGVHATIRYLVLHKCRCNLAGQPGTSRQLPDPGYVLPALLRRCTIPDSSPMSRFSSSGGCHQKVHANMRAVSCADEVPRATAGSYGRSEMAEVGENAFQDACIKSCTSSPVGNVLQLKNHIRCERSTTVIE